MKIPDAVTVGVVLYGTSALGLEDLERESSHAANLAARLGADAKKSYGQAIQRLVPADRWGVILARQRLDTGAELLASVHFFAERPDPALVAGALAVFAHAWLHRRENGAEPPGSLPLADMPPGPLSSAKTLREAASLVNAIMLDDGEHGAWMRAYEAAWDAGPSGN